MPTQQNQKPEPIDLSKVFAKKEQAPIPQQGQNFLRPRKLPWSRAKKKQKIEIVILIALVALIIGVLAYYFLRSKPKTEESPYAPPAEEQYMP